MVQNQNNERFDEHNQRDDRHGSNSFFGFLKFAVGGALAYTVFEGVIDLIKSDKVKHVDMKLKDLSANLDTWGPDANQEATNAERDETEADEAA